MLIGDAAHATVPFFGQGMNAALEDALCIGEALDGPARGDIRKAAAVFSAKRQRAGEALCDLSMENYVEMRHKTASPWFRARSWLEKLLQKVAPTYWVPLYSMVSFTRIPYDVVVERAAQQDALLETALRIGVVALGGAVAWLVIKLRKS